MSNGANVVKYLVEDKSDYVVNQDVVYSRTADDLMMAVCKWTAE